MWRKELRSVVELQKSPAEGEYVSQKEQSRRRKLRNRLVQSIADSNQRLQTRAMVIEHADWAREQLLTRIHQNVAAS